MKAAVVREVRKPVSIEERPRPEPGPGEILVRILASGICHSDLHILDDEMPSPHPLPLVVGHEGAGTVEAVGADVTKWRVGDRAGIPWLRWACGECRECIEGWEPLCAGMRGTGFDEDGCWAEYAVCPAAFAARIPEKLSWEQAAPVLCAGVTSYKAVKLSGTRPGRTLGVFGIGGLGHLGLQYGKLAGARVIAVDIHAAKLSLAEELGADACVDASQGDAHRRIRRQGGVDDAVVFATSARAIRDAVKSLKPNGSVVVAALPPGEVPLRASDLVDRGVRLVGTALGTRQDLMEVLDLAASGRVQVKVETCRLEDVNTVLDSMRAHRLDAARKVIQL
ncbi:MAG: zinc-dependent alcohol dehydrogenase [Acidobacteriota bacterium]|nr:zinc-dependent alcohol dehydrogenase [Acidobacteriota bacterium]